MPLISSCPGCYSISLRPLSNRDCGTLSIQRTTMLVAENIWLKMHPAFHFFSHVFWNYDSRLIHQARSWRSFNLWDTSGDGDKRLCRVWRSKSFEREQVSFGIGFFGRVFLITFVSVASRNSPNYPPSSSRTKRSKRKAVRDLNPEDSQRNNLNTKRSKVDDNASYNYILQACRNFQLTT
jgi:hypothetical protein